MSTYKAEIFHTEKRVQKEDLRLGILLVNPCVGFLYGSFSTTISETSEGYPLGIPFGKSVDDIVDSLRGVRGKGLGVVYSLTLNTTLEGETRAGLKKGFRELVPYLRGPRE
jgi:hypothetical protein